MSPLSWWRWWRSLPRNPVYLREKGSWGNPNPFYDNLSRYSPFVIMGAILFGICAGVANPTLFSASNELFAFWCFVCLPGILLNTLSTFGSLMAPALTAPTVSMEMDRGTWDILRVTPQTTRSILLAKLFGAMARLRVWPALFVLSMLQGLLVACSLTLADRSTAFTAPFLGAATIARPWLEILFAGLTGMYVSTRVRSATVALAASYSAVLMVKLFNSSGVWIAVAGFLELGEAILVAGSAGPVVIYALIVASLWFSLVHEAKRLSYE